ncbi:MAG: response regulator [Thiomargarita sp.]|nr:response regulator [Thiomargarita sp.]
MSDTPLKILIVDDDDTNLLVLRSMLQKYFDNIQVIEANSGINALSYLTKKIVDLIILDIQMPQMDGFETAKMIQSRSKTKHIPIVFLTAVYKSDDFKNRGYDVGAVDYLIKPIQPLKLTEKISFYLRFIQQQHLHNREEEAIEQKVDEQIADLQDKSLQQEMIDRKHLQEISQELSISLNTIIGYKEALKKITLNLAYTKGMSELNKIDDELKKMLNLSKKCNAAL